MSINSLFPASSPGNPALASRVRALLASLRRSSPVLAPGCGCLLPRSPVSVRDFEEALLFHLKERWRTLGKDTGQSLPPAVTLDDLLDWIETSGTEPQLQPLCHALLEDMQRSVASFATQCSVHATRAEAY